MAYNVLEEAFNMKDSFSTNYKLPFTRNDLFRKEKFDLEYFNMTFTQRISAFFVCLALAMFFFIYSMLNILGAVFSPYKFAFLYSFANYLFFVMFGFLFGFKSYMKKVLSEKKRKYTLAFLTCTLLNLYTAFFFKNYFLQIALLIMQIGTFISFVVAFLPGGTDGMTSIVSLMFKR